MRSAQSRGGLNVAFTALQAGLDRLGLRLKEIDGTDSDYQRWWLAESRVWVVVTSTGWDDRLRPGDVWSISAPYSALDAVGNATSAQLRSVKDRLNHLLRLDQQQRSAWLDRRQPALAERANWWLCLMQAVDQKLYGRGKDVAEWVSLQLWLLEQGAARGVLSSADSAMRRAYFVTTTLRDRPELCVSLPSADDVVKACLAAMPAARDQVAVLDDRRDLHRLDLDTMRQSRQAKNLVNAAQWHLNRLRDDRLVDELRAWIALKPYLV